jgi:hypothetical protein
MVGNKRIEAIRLAATAGIATLGVAATYYPHNMWVPAIIAIAGAVGIHVVPSVSENGDIMTTPTGPELMGLVRPVEQAVAPAVPAVETAAEAVEAAVKEPDTATVETAIGDAVIAGEAVAKVAPDAAQALRDAADSLRKIADSLV